MREICHLSDGVGYSEYRFKVNKPPHSGICDVEPRSGFSLTSKFKVSCSNWFDEDLPLTYQIGMTLQHSPDRLVLQKMHIHIGSYYPFST